MIDESADWIVVDKPAHLLVHPSKPNNPPTLLDGLEDLLRFEIETGGQISIINRLDRETSGIVLAAKSKSAAAQLAAAMRQREFSKFYLAIVHGIPEQDDFVVKEPIARLGRFGESKIHLRRAVHSEGKDSETRFKVLQRFDKGPFSLVRCEPVTGRMHQIRVHLERAGFPIVGDKIYGHSGDFYLEFIETGWTESLQNQLPLNRQALHASTLIWKNHHWKSPLPDDLCDFLKKVGEIPESMY